MHCFSKYISFGLLALLGCSCSRPDDSGNREGTLFKTNLHVSTLAPEEHTLLPTIQAANQMNPEDLNPIKTLAVYQYDPEGNRREFSFHDYTNGGQIPGEMSVEFPVELRAYGEGLDATICLIANMDESMCRDIYNNSPLLTDFQAYHKVDVPYEGMSGSNLGAGHLTTSYMSGYYEGPVIENTSISVALGRIISNFNIGIIVSEDFPSNSRPSQVRLQLQNIPMQTFAFPPRVSDYEGLSIPRGSFQEESLQVSTTEYNRCYYYVAAFAALTKDDACRLHISTTINGQTREATVLLGNDEPGTPNRSYNVWRNSNYTFNLRLVPKGNKKSQYEARPGEIIVPL